jgi:large subunit ribosomal protein L24e
MINQLYISVIIVDAMKRVEKIRQRRQAQYMMQRLRKGRELETQRDIKEVQRDLSLIRSPAAGLKQRRAMEESIVEEIHESDVEMEEAI